MDRVDGRLDVSVPGSESSGPGVTASSESRDAGADEYGHQFDMGEEGKPNQVQENNCVTPVTHTKLSLTHSPGKK